MGGKRNRAGQHLCFCAAGLIMVALAGCAPFEEMLKKREGGDHLQQGQLLVRQGDFTGALRENEKALALTPKTPPGDAALFEMALIEADPANPQKDYRQALSSFRDLGERFPQSTFARQAALWSPFLEKELSAEQAGRLHLQRMQELARQGQFAEAVQENERLLLPTAGPCADAALFSMGLICADQANPQNDHKKALEYFGRLVAEYPASRYAEEGRIWGAILKGELSAEREGGALLKQVRLLIRQGNFEAALQESQAVLARAPKSPPADAALFALALVYADRSNPKPDLRRAISLLTQLGEDFPHSPLAEDARIWLVPLKGELSAEREGHAHLQRMQGFLRKGDFEGALKEDQRILSAGVKGQPVDAALFSMGIIYADQANPKRDFKKALGFFARLRREHPGSPLVEEAKVWIGVLETMEKSLRVDLEIEEKKNELRR